MTEYQAAAKSEANVYILCIFLRLVSFHIFESEYDNLISPFNMS